MSFNKNANKRLSLKAGIERYGKETVPLVNDIVRGYLTEILRKLTVIIDHCGRKTIKTEDLCFLSILCPDFSVIIHSNEINRHEPFTQKKPFYALVRKILGSVRINGKALRLLQHLTEAHVIEIMSIANIINTGETLSLETLEKAAAFKGAGILPQ